MTDYRELAAAELAKIRAANDVRTARARALRLDGQDTRADEVEAVAAETSFRVAEAYTALASLGGDVPPPAAAPEDAP